MNKVGHADFAILPKNKEKYRRGMKRSLVAFINIYKDKDVYI